MVNLPSRPNLRPVDPPPLGASVRHPLSLPHPGIRPRTGRGQFEISNLRLKSPSYRWPSARTIKAESRQKSQQSCLIKAHQGNAKKQTSPSRAPTARPHTSPGQRPGFGPRMTPALKGRPNPQSRQKPQQSRLIKPYQGKSSHPRQNGSLFMAAPSQSATRLFLRHWMLGVRCWMFRSHQG